MLSASLPVRSNLTPGPVASFTGALLVYSPQYAYEAGLAYTAGALQPLRMSVYTALPGLPPPDTCYDYYLVGYDNTGAQVVHDYLFSSGNCLGNLNLNINWGGGGGTPATGGGGGGANGTLTPTTVLVVPPTTPVVSIQQYLKCFNVNQAATLTIYVKQAVTGTTATYNGTDVGHAFISLSQNGTTRVFGFYPSSNAVVLFPVTRVFGDDSQHDYDVSITTTIPPASLNNILNYTYNYTSNYSLQHNNCVNFVIGAGAQLNWGLPNTQGTWVGVFSGSNPGNFGEDMRTMTLPSGVSRNLTGGTAPSNAGSCP